MDSKGKIFPMYGQKYKELVGGHWTDGNNVYCDPNGSNSVNGDGCAARIMENGWRMDY